MTPCWRRYVRAFSGSALRVALGGALAVAAGVPLVPIPLLLGHAFDRTIPDGRSSDLLRLGLALLALQVLASALTLATRVVVLNVTKEAIAHLRREAIARLLAAPRSLYSRHAPAALHNLLVSETERIDVMSQALIAEITPAVVLSLGICAVLAAMNWRLFLTMVAVLPMSLVAGRLLGRRMRARTQRFHEAFARFSRGVLFAVRAADLIRTQEAESVEAQRQAAHIADLRRTSTSMAIAGTTYMVAQQSLIACAGVVVLVAGGSAVASGAMSPGQLLSFFAGLLLLRMPLNTVLTSAPRLIEGFLSLATFVAFLDGDDQPPYDGRQPIAFTGHLELRDVTFGYGGQPVLDGLSLTLAAGETVALIGPNGAGKSTVVSLILGFYRPQRGQLSASGVLYETVDLHRLRRQIGVVPQDPIMVAGTIRDNLLYGAAEPPWDMVLNACRRAGVDAFVAALPQGYDTPIGEDGEALSGGQRQRLSIARALLGEPRLLILDEPLNHLDEASGAAFFERLFDDDRRPTILLISHRPDVISVAGRIIHIDAGRIVRIEIRADRPTPVAAHATNDR